MIDRDDLIKCACAVVISIGFVYAATGLRTLIPETKYMTDSADTSTASAPEISYKTVDAPEATSADGVISAEDWKEIYPNQYQTMLANSENELQTDYLEQDPYLKTLYEGYGFAKDYKMARGHTYDLEDVHDTARPHATANCLTCKTPNFTKLVNDIGVEAYTMDFEEVYSGLNEGISCYNCHGNEAGDKGKLVVTHSYTAKALGDSVNEMNPANVACGQCHTEYYFHPGDLEATVPYSSLEDMNPEAELAYYNEIEFSDWTQESTGTQMLKVQHPEFETVSNGIHAQNGMSCADCHMAIETDENGETYHSHKWVSPLEDETLLNSCAKCHGDTDMAAKVADIQANVTAREKEVGEKLAALKEALAAAVTEGKMSEDQLNEIRQLYRDGQFFWDYSYVENSEGAHNSSMDLDCLKRAEEKAEEAMKLLEA